MKLSFYLADPAGNLTIFVTTPVPPQDIAPIAARLLALPEYHAEQVAFQVSPQQGGTGRIQMMGGEFCGNATRSFGYLLSMLSPAHPQTVAVEISGAELPLTVEIDHKKGTCKTQMPLLAETKTVAYLGETFDVMIFDGIVHTIVPGQPRTEDFVRGLIAAVQQMAPSDAYGVMFLTAPDQLVPAVYVCDTHSLVWESSCGSGSIACATHLALPLPDGTYEYEFHQPGGMIEATVGIKNGKVILCQMGGPVAISPLMTADVAL